MVIIDSRRLSASRGELACSVPIEPSWPVFIACSRSNASGPRTSPTMIRSGRMRRQFLTRSRIVDLAAAFEVGRPGLQPHHVRLLQLQFGGVLAGDDPLVGVDEGGQAVEQRRLARAGAAGDEDVAAHAADDLEHSRACGRDRAEADQLVEGQLVLLELPDGQRRAVERQRRRDDVDAASRRAGARRRSARLRRRGGRPG